MKIKTTEAASSTLVENDEEQKPTPQFVPVRPIAPIDGDGVFRIRLHSFQLIDKATSRYPGLKLRFVLTWCVYLKGPEGIEEIGQDQEGCLARVNKDGVLVWTTSQHRSGSYYRNVLWSTPALYERVRAALERTKYVEKLKTPVLSIVKKPQDIDPDLPEEVLA